LLQHNYGFNVVTALLGPVPFLSAMTIVAVMALEGLIDAAWCAALAVAGLL